MDGWQFVGALGARLVWLVFVFSFGEWLIHKYMLHGKWLWRHGPSALRFVYQDHAIDHHGNERNERLPYIDLTAKDYWPLLVPFGVHAVLYFRHGWEGSGVSMLALVIMTVTHCLLWNGMHRAMHGLEPGNWASRLPWYEFLRRHHAGHHIDPRRNLNVVFPIADYVLRTVYTPNK